MDDFITSDKHIFTQKMLRKFDMDVIYTSMVANDKSIFVFGGDGSPLFQPSVEVMKYNVALDTWYHMSDMPRYLWGATAQIIGNNIFIMGGGRQSAYYSYNLVYNISSDSWTERAELPISRKGLVSGVINGTIYIACGYQMWGAYGVTSYCYAYLEKLDTWRECKCPLRYRSFAMSVVIDDFLYVLGGYSPDAKKGESTKMDRYCPKTDLWECMPDMPRPRIDSVAVAIDSKIFILCGSSKEDYITMDYYDTKSRKWTISDIPTPQLNSPGVAVIDNKIYLTVGKNRLGEYNRNLYEITYGGIKE